MDRRTTERVMVAIKRLDERKEPVYRCPPKDVALLTQALDQAVINAANQRAEDMENTDGWVRPRLG